MKALFKFDDLCRIEPRIKFYEKDSGEEIAQFWNLMCGEWQEIEYVKIDGIEDNFWTPTYLTYFKHGKSQDSCEGCGGYGNWVADPYILEMSGEEHMKYLCSGCYAERVMDV